MNHTLLVLCALLVVANPGFNLLQATQKDQGKPVPITPLAPANSGQRRPITSGLFMDQLRIVVRDRDTWVQVWQRINTGPDSLPLPEIDFTREMLVVAAMGLRPSSGYRIVIEKAFLYEQYPRLEVVIHSIDNTKCPGLGQFPVVTAQLDIVRLPRTDRPVVFRETDAPDCPKLTPR